MIMLKKEYCWKRRQGGDGRGWKVRRMEKVGDGRGVNIGGVGRKKEWQKDLMSDGYWRREKP